jgi:hypothetical protein
MAGNDRIAAIESDKATGRKGSGAPAQDYQKLTFVVEALQFNQYPKINRKISFFQ